MNCQTTLRNRAPKGPETDGPTCIQKWNHRAQRWFRLRFHSQFHLTALEDIRKADRLRLISTAKSCQQHRTKSCNESSVECSASCSVSGGAKSFSILRDTHTTNENRYAQKATSWPGVTPLWLCLTRPKSVPDFGGHSRPRMWLRVPVIGWHVCQPTCQQLCQHICWRTRWQVRVVPHDCATDSIPAFTQRRTRLRMPQGSSKESPTAGRRKERGLDPSACASAITFPTIAGMSHRVRWTNHVTTKVHAAFTNKRTIQLQGTSIPKDACIAQSVCSLHLYSRRKPLQTRCLAVLTVTNDSLLAPSSPWSSYA